MWQRARVLLTAARASERAERDAMCDREVQVKRICRSRGRNVYKRHAMGSSREVDRRHSHCMRAVRVVCIIANFYLQLSRHGDLHLRAPRVTSGTYPGHAPVSRLSAQNLNYHKGVTAVARVSRDETATPHMTIVRPNIAATTCPAVI